jgi:hypothetical protein
MSTLHSFINDLLKAHEIASAGVIIVDDNAKLTLENRLRVSASFLSHDEASDRRPCRWSSTPVLRSGNSPTAPSRKDTSSQSKKSGSQNATWDDFKRPSALNISSVGTTSKKSRSSSRTPTERGASLQKANSFTAPKRPERCFSPHNGGKMHISRSTSLSVCPISVCPITGMNVKQYKGNSKNSKSTKQQTIRNALGSMAPSSKNTLKRSSPKRSSRKSLQLSSKSDAQPLSRDLPPTLCGFKLSSPTPYRGSQRNWAEEAREGLEVPRAVDLAEVC